MLLESRVLIAGFVRLLIIAGDDDKSENRQTIRVMITIGC